MMRVIGTAGHVDHGKSTLVQALTGMHPDRLKEEKLREMTIDLGFAWLVFPNNKQVGIVDVPGHRDFIENMLAGVGGIDAILFVIAADEGIKPQTREHLAIIDLLDIRAGLIVLTKIDLIEDQAWLDLLESDIRDAMKGTVLENAEILRVSATTGLGIEELKSSIGNLLESTPARTDIGKPRLPIDRVFSIAGFGTVVTGTLLDGSFSVGEEVVVLPSGKRARIRGLQNHKTKVQTANPGSRTAVNIAGIDVSEAHRGDVLARPGGYAPSNRLDVNLRLLGDIGVTLKHNQEIKIFAGSSESEGRVRLLESRELHPGERALAQIESVHPLVLAEGDRFILRRPSPAITLGGGVVLDPHPTRRYRASDRTAVERLKLMEAEGNGERVFDPLVSIDFSIVSSLAAESREEKGALMTRISGLINSGSLIQLGEGSLADKSLVISFSKWIEHTQNVIQTVQRYHEKYPLRSGIPREELRNLLHFNAQAFSTSLAHWLRDGVLASAGNILKIPGHQIIFTPLQQQAIERLFQQFRKSPFSPPSVDEARQIAGEDVLSALIELGEIVKVSGDILFLNEAYREMCRFILKKAEQGESFSVGEFRDRFQSSRKYALAFLESLDTAGITRREGEGRVVIHPEKLRSSS